MTEDDVLTTFQAAELCHTSFMSVHRWIQSGALHAYKTPGGHHRILKKDLIRFMVSNNIPVPVGTPGGKTKILIVDDDENVRNGLKRYFSHYKHEFEVMTAKDGFEAGVRITQFMPEVVLLDLMMPNMNGFSVCSEIKANHLLKNIKIIILTGYGSEENIRIAYKAGADKVLCKPMTNEAIMKEINKILARFDIYGRASGNI